MGAQFEHDGEDVGLGVEGGEEDGVFGGAGVGEGWGEDG